MVEFIKKHKTILIGLLIAFIIVLVDQITKIIIANTMDEYDTIKVIPNFMNFYFTYNTGAAFSWLDDNTLFLALISLTATVGFGYLVLKTCDYDFKLKRIYSISMAFMLGGTIGNLIDRFMSVLGMREGVIDFFDMWLFGWQFPGVFNVADIFLVVGVGLLMIDILFLSDKREKLMDQTLENEVSHDENI